VCLFSFDLLVVPLSHPSTRLVLLPSLFSFFSLLSFSPSLLCPILAVIIILISPQLDDTPPSHPSIHSSRINVFLHFEQFKHHCKPMGKPERHQWLL
jgi:hypothetical protein